jgi:hypothetical protein
METWRDRGFVPDSDEEEEYDSQDYGKVVPLQDEDKDKALDTANLPVTQEDSKAPAEARVSDDQEEAHWHEHSQQSVELVSDDELHQTSPSQKAQDTRRTFRRNSPSIDPNPFAQNDHSLDNGSPSSSEDELQVVDAPRRKPAFTAVPKTPATPAQQLDLIIHDDESLSSLSPPPSTIVSPQQSQRESQGNAILPPIPRPPPEHSVMEDTNNNAGRGLTLNELEDIFPSLDIPADILQELSQPMQRSLRQRNPIQLHPYLLEDAKYRGLLKGTGLRPIRVPLANPDAPRPQNQDESQESDLGPAAPPSSSPSAAFVPPPSSPPDPYSPLRPREQHRTPISLPRNLPSDSHATKRRKLFHNGGEKNDRSKQLSMQIVIDNTDLSLDNETPTVDALLSPPRSGSLSSASTVRPDGFRFPRGFIPPKTAPTTTIDLTPSGADDVAELDEMETDGPVEDVEDAPAPIEDDKYEEKTQLAKDREVKKLQRRIKGVLPASWLRLDLKQKATQVAHEKRQRDPQTTQAEPARGVARKIAKTKRTDVDSSERRRPLELYVETSSSEDESVPQAQSLDAHADFIRFDDPFQEFRGNEDDGDIPEDNRIDDTFPSIPRSSSGPRKPRSNKPKTYGPKETGQLNLSITRRHIPRQRQTRLDDNIHRPRSHPKSRPRAPRLSILDAPDVATRSKTEQPQFLRIAARQARSRRDQGRSSPSRKVFKMVDRNDTEDTNKILREWKSGAMKQTTLPTPRVQKKVRESSKGVLKINRKRTKEHQAPVARTQQQQVTKKARTRVLESLSSESENEMRAHPAASLAAKRAEYTDKRKPTRLGNKWVVPRAFGISSLKRNAPRTAEFEVGLENNRPSDASFKTSLDALNRTYGRDYGRREFGQSVTLDRFLAQTNPLSQRNLNKKTAQKLPLPQTVPSESRDQGKKRPAKKRPPTRLAMDDDVDDTLQIPSFFESNGTSVNTADGFQQTKALYQLKNSATLSVDFKMMPLRVGTFFHDSTFIGRTEFSRSLDMKSRDLDQSAGFSVIRIGDQMFRWAAWNDAVSSEFGSVVELIMQDTNTHDPQTETTPTQHDNLQAFVSLIRYVTEKLHFMDSVDRQTFVDRAIHISAQLRDYVTLTASLGDEKWKQCIRLASLNLVFANQARQIADHSLVDPSKLENAVRIVKDLCRQVLSLVFNKLGLAEVRRFYEDNKIADRREAGIHDNFPSVEAYVVVFQLLQSSDIFQKWFQDITLSLANDASAFTDVQPLEDTWKAIFTTIPLNEVDKFGIARPGLRFQCKHDNWPVVQRLINTVLDAYDPKSKSQLSYINYCRVLFHRCFVLMASWGWRDCKPILDTLFDFFAKHTLYNLKNEQSFGSPSFLDYLDKNPSLEVQPGDSCFHIFLKIVGSGLRYLSGIYGKKKIMNFAWRLLPNHGRVYPKEKMLHHEDLDSLRNHHDLLCTLYWAVPDGCRPRVETIRDLVDPATSHLETCNLSIRSWRRLSQFKLSTDEDVSGLKPFADWYEYFVSELVRQHTLARTEVEAQANSGGSFSKQLIESTISQNQRQIESLISSTLGGMKSSIDTARSMDQAYHIMTGVPFGKLLGLFNPTQARVNGVIKETLQVIINFIEIDTVSISKPAAPIANDDSQEYGDWSAIEEIYDAGRDVPESSETILYLKDKVQPDVSQLVSNCFGEDRSPEDSLLLKTTECWACLAQLLVKHGLHSWDSYINPYGRLSWAALRTTSQTKKYTPQFLASCIAKNHNFITECRTQILAMWMSCLVERMSMLKFQHRLTEAVMNEDGASPLLQNLPFHLDRKDNLYHITLSELTERRISLISCLLSNMREHLQNIEDSAAQGLTTTREEYKELIMTLMSSMKANYQELGQQGNTVQGKYVEFVQRIVGFLQQHSQTICPIDKFFTDPTSFPLPADDPTYIVARLKSYGVRLSSTKIAKQLVMFLQSVSERTAVDGQQGYLIEQLCTCTNETYETGDSNKPTLRSFLLQCVFPAYIECSFNKAGAWILVWPILQATSRILSEMIYDIDINDTGCMSSVASMIEAVFSSIRHAIRLTVDHPGLLEESPVLVTMQSFVGIVTSSLQILDYMKRAAVISDDIVSLVDLLRKNILFAAAILLDPSMAVNPEPSDSLLETTGRLSPALHSESRTFATNQLQAWLRTSWSVHDGKYFLRRGQGQQTIEIDSGVVKVNEVQTLENAKTGFLNAAEVFLARVNSLDLLDERALEPIKRVNEETKMHDYDDLTDEMDALLL